MKRDAQLDRLVDAARAVARNAYAPYSGFGVGAAVLLADGSIIAGCNLENASYGLALCAEAAALAAVNSAGRMADVRAIAIAGGRIAEGGIAGTDPVRPCGRCRQLIHEAACIAEQDLPVHCAAATGDAIETHAISALLPHAFGPADL